MDQEQSFFDFAAEVGLTKHLGGQAATEEMIELCRIGPGSVVLDVGCGAGVTPCFIAKRCDCRVVGVDISPRMIERSKERAVKEGVADRVQFRVADVQELPFEEALFDAVISESVTAFPENQQRAVNEYARVTRPGGFVGLNESTWLQVPPPPEIVAWAQQDVGATVSPLTSSAWQALLENAGLREIVVRIRAVDAKEETKGILQRYGLGGMLRSMGRALRLYLCNPAYRRFVKSVGQGGIVPENLDQYFGYGLFAGQKPGD